MCCWNPYQRGPWSSEVASPRIYPPYRPCHDHYTSLDNKSGRSAGCRGSSYSLQQRCHWQPTTSSPRPPWSARRCYPVYQLPTALRSCFYVSGPVLHGCGPSRELSAGPSSWRIDPTPSHFAQGAWQTCQAARQFKGKAAHMCSYACRTDYLKLPTPPLGCHSPPISFKQKHPDQPTQGCKAKMRQANILLISKLLYPLAFFVIFAKLLYESR